MADKITEEELYDLKKAFNSFDKNSDGKISFEEFKQALNSSGEPRSDKDLKELVI